MSKQKNGRTLFKGGTIVTMDPKVPNLATGDVLVDGDRIAAVGVNLQADGAEVIDATGSIVMPGLVDAHHHMWLGVMRRMMPDVDDLFAYIDVVAETLGAHYRPLDMYLSTKLTAVASLDAGITTIIDACHSSRSPSTPMRRSTRSTMRHPRAAHGRRGDGQEGLRRAFAGGPRSVSPTTGTMATAWCGSACSASSISTGGRSRAASTCAS
jgi:cytosine/adenosine deaminase-related metal-dependent hydrolase